MRKIEEHEKVIYILDKNEKHIICTESSVGINAKTVELMALISCIASYSVEAGVKSGIGKRTMKMLLKEAVEIGLDINDAKSSRRNAMEIRDDIESILDDFFGVKS